MYSAAVRRALLCLSLVLAWPALASATPQDLFGFGGRSPGLAMTGVSYADDYEAVFLNPAGLARARRRGLHLGASAGGFLLKVDDQRFALDPSRGTLIGATLPLPFGDILEDRLAIGLGVYTPGSVLLRGQVQYPELAQWPVLGRTQSIAIQLGLRFDFHSTDLEGLRVGIGVSALADVIGDLDVRLDETNTFNSVVETQLLATFSPIAGVSYERGEWGGGIVYRHEVRSSMNLRIVTDDLPIDLPVLTIGGLIQYDPHTLAGEIFWRPDPGIRIVANLTARFWSSYPGPFTATSGSSLSAPPPGFSDTVSPRVAIEGTLRRGPVTLELRGGYLLEPTPAPAARAAQRRNPDGSGAVDARGEPVLAIVRFLDNDRHVLTAGLGMASEVGTARLSLDVFGQAHFLVDRVHDVSSTSDGTDGTPSMRTTGFVLVAGWTLGLEF